MPAIAMPVIGMAIAGIGCHRGQRRRRVIRKPEERKPEYGANAFARLKHGQPQGLNKTLDKEWLMEAPIDSNKADVDEAAIRVVPAGASGPPSVAADLPASAASSEEQRWHNILASFVEDPRSSLKAASEIVREDASAFVALLGQWQESLPGAAPGDRGGETEKMRQALVIYRDVSRQLATSIQSLG